MTRVGGSKLVDVAQRAECSVATVSRVLNGNPTVAPQIRDRVLQAAAVLGYVPNGSARALRSSQTRLVGAVIPTLDHAIYASMVDGLQARLAEKNISLLLSTSMYDRELEFEQARLLIEHGAEALVLVGTAHKPELIELLEQRSLPYVFTYTVGEAQEGAAIGFDNEQAGRTAARFLLDLGHKRLAMIAGITQDNDRAKGRVVGFLDELERRGFAAESVPVVEGRYSIRAGHSAMKDLLRRKTRPTAVFCGSDILAAGALKCCQENGLKVPLEISILGFDNLETAELTSPELSTLEVPAREMGRLVGDYLIASPAQRRNLHRRELSIRLIVRGSTGVAPNQV